MHLKKFFVVRNFFFGKYLIVFFSLQIGRVCYGKYHWRCVKPQRVSRYGQNHDYICGNCNDSTAINLSHRSSNGNNITESFDTNDRDFVNETSRTNSTETNPENNIRNYEDKQPEKTRKITELDDYLPSKTNEEEYNLENSKILNEKHFFFLSKVEEKKTFVVNLSKSLMKRTEVHARV